MSLSSLRRWARRMSGLVSGSGRGRQAQRPKKRQSPLAVEGLEDRTVPTALTINVGLSPSAQDLVTIDSSGGGVKATIDGQTYQFAPGFINSITVNAPAGNDGIGVNSTLPNVPLTVNLGSGTDTVTVSGYNYALPGTGYTGGNLDLIQGGVTVNGGSGYDSLNVDDTGNTYRTTYTLTASGITRPGSAPISYNRMSAVGLTAGGYGGDTVVVPGPLATPTTVNAGVYVGGRFAPAGLAYLDLPDPNTTANLTVTQPASTGSGTWTFGNGVGLAFSGVGTLNDAGTLTSIPTAAFLSHAYQDLLGRSIEFGALTSWSAQLNAGLSRTQFALDVVNGNEYHQDLVKGWYQKYLGRAADPGGLSDWTGLLNSGWTNESVQAAFLASQEFFQDSGSTNAGFVNNLYQDVLNRPADPGGLAAWLGALNAGYSRTTVAMDFLTSAEYRTDLVESYYMTYLRRPGDPGGVNGWVGQLNAGYTDESVLADFIGSQEYYNKWL